MKGGPGASIDPAGYDAAPGPSLISVKFLKKGREFLFSISQRHPKDFSFEGG
jgi:hypothetical protein